MAKTLDIESIITPDQMGTALANKYLEWDLLKANHKAAIKELRQYLYATDTTQTTNAKLPWKNKTTVPKICQISDNLFANYKESLFPKSGIVEWVADERKDQTKEKTETMEAVSEYVINQPNNREILYRLILDWIHEGNCFATIEWRDDTVTSKTGISSGYIGPQFVRINPDDIVFNPTAPDFKSTPKIVRSLMTLGELKSLIESNSIYDNQEEVEKAFAYLRDVRHNVSSGIGEFSSRNDLYSIAGFTSFVSYLTSNYVELLTFYGDYYDSYSDKLYKNSIITVADRHKVLGIRENPSLTGNPPIYHIGWRPRPDNLWAMGPLENLVGMQYRIDHLENLKADVFDLIAAPPLMIKGLVEDFEWGPFARVYVGDDGDIKPLAPEAQALQANIEIQNLMNLMEEMAGSPKEAAGFRTPGEKTAYEVQRLENAANRIFYNKTKQFEELFFEIMLNDSLEMMRRKMTSKIVVRVFNEETNATSFLSISQDDLAGVGRIRPIAARNFAEKAEKVQNINNFFSSVMGQDPEIKAHFSTIALARMFEELLDIEPYEVVQPYVRITEQQEAQKLLNTGQEDVAMQAMTPSGVSPEDVSV